MILADPLLEGNTVNLIETKPYAVVTLFVFEMTEGQSANAVAKNLRGVLPEGGVITRIETRQRKLTIGVKDVARARNVLTASNNLDLRELGGLLP